MGCGRGLFAHPFILPYDFSSNNGAVWRAISCSSFHPVNPDSDILSFFIQEEITVSRQPNIVVIITDQQRTDTMACYGNGWIQSPHHDALAERSFVFENAYVTQAVCTPSRGSLITGLYPHSHGCVVNGIPLREETLSIAEMMPNTYRKGYVGKWHLGDDGNCQHGFDEWCSIADGCGYHQWLLDQGFAPDAAQ